MSTTTSTRKHTAAQTSSGPGPLDHRPHGPHLGRQRRRGRGGRRGPGVRPRGVRLLRPDHQRRHGRPGRRALELRHHHHVTPVTPVAPSETIIVLQRELGQLNYYEGPITGTMNEQTVQAITYLQRDAHLPQTGTMTPATQSALQHFLATGNNQMGGNS